MPRGLMVLMAVVCAALSISSGAAAGAEGGADSNDRSTASEREQARTRFEQLGRLEALQLARREFPAKLDRPVWKGPRGLDDAKRYLGDATAVVDPPGDARPTLVQSSLPLRARDEGGRMAPLDLELVERAGALEASNALVETRVGRRAGEGLQFGEGIDVKFAGVADEAEAMVEGERAFFADTLPATDQIVAAHPQGVELLWQVRGRAAPERFGLDFSLPAGARLRLVEVRKGLVGVEVVRDAKVLMVVQPPTAMDAERTPVPVEYELKGNRLWVELAHRDRDVLYPLLVDPWMIQENWLYRDGDYSVNWRSDPNLDFLGWRTNRRWGGAWFQTQSGFGRGLWAGFDPWQTGHGEWEWQAPGNARVFRADFAEPSLYGQGGCVIHGIRRADDSYEDTSNSRPYEPMMPSTHPCDGPWGFQSYCMRINPCGVDGSTQGSKAFFGAYRTSSVNARWDAYVPGASVSLTDLDRPWLTNTSSWENLLEPYNWSFEDDQAHWRPGWADGGSWVASYKVHGERHYSIRRRAYEGLGGYAFSRSKEVAAQPGKSYRASFFARPEWGVRPALARAELIFSDHNGAETGRTYGDWARETGAWDWRRVPDVKAIAPAGTASVNLTMAFSEMIDWQWHNADAALLEEECAGCPAAWTHRAKRHVALGATDGGLGANRLRFATPRQGGGETVEVRQHPCEGHRNHNCPAAWNRDQAGYNQVFPYDTDSMPEGVNRVGAQALDVLDNPSHGTHASPEFDRATLPATKIDRSAPRADLGGSLYAGRGSFLSRDDQTLTVAATDSYSGVKSVEYNIKSTASGPALRSGIQTNASCDQGGCSTGFSPSFSVDLAGLESGRYIVAVTTKDQLGDEASNGPAHRRVDSFEIEIDRTPPQVTSVVTTPDRWLKDGDEATTTVSATDGGSGIKSFGLTFPDGSEATTISRDCGGLTATATPPRCAASDSAVFGHQVTGTRFPAEGRVQVRGKAKDPAGNESAPRSGDVRIDRSPPKQSLGGSFYLSKNTLLVLDTYQLTFDAMDGSTASPDKERSGARQVRIEVKKEGAGEPFVEKFRTAEQPCPQSSCALRGEWTFQTAAYERDKRYTVRVIATDQLGHAATEEFDVYVMRPLGQALSLLPDRLGLEDYWHYDSTATGAGTQAHTNLQTGNLVWQASPIVNPGRGLSTFANLTYNSQESQADALRPENLAGDLLGQYNEVGRGFSLGISGVTRLNEPLDLSQLAAGKVTLTDADGTRHLFESPVGSPDFGEVFTPPPGVQLHLRRWSTGIVDPVTGLGLLTEPDKAYAMTRPDGVTYFFDQFGYATSIRDRNANTIKFKYEYRSPTKLVCDVADPALRPPDKVCVRKVVEVVDPAGNDKPNPSPGRSLKITYKPRRIADLTASLTPSGGLPAALQGQEFEPNDPSPGLAWASGPVERITDHKGRVHEFVYDDNGYLKTFIEAKGAQSPAGGSDQRSWGFDYEDDPDTSPLFKREPLSAVRNPRLKATSFTHKSDSEVSGQENCGAQYAAAGEHGDAIVHRRRVKALTDRGEQSSGRASRLFSYSCADEGGKQVHRAEVTDARDKLWKHKIDALGKPEEMEDPRGTKTALEWDGDNNPSKITRAAGSADQAGTTLVYNDNGQLLKSTDPEAHATDLTYEPARGIGALRSPRTRFFGLESRSIDSDRSFVTDLTSIRKPKRGTTSFEYDDLGNVRFTTDARGFRAETGYDQHGQVVEEWDQQRNRTQYPSEHYDPNGLPRRVIDPRGKVWNYTYDAVGNVTSVMDPRHDGTVCGSEGRQRYRTELLYDSYDRLLRQFVPKNSSQCEFIQRDRRYDSNGNLIEETDGNRHVRTRTYTATDQLEEDRSPATPHADGTTASEVSRRDYDAEDNLVLQTAPRGTRTTDVAEDFATRLTVDEIGRKVAETRQSRGTESENLTTSFAYDRRDNVVGLVDPAHNAAGGDPVANAVVTAKRRFTYRYDRADNRIEEIEDPGDKAFKTATVYDANDNAEKVTDPRGTATAADGDFTLTRTYDSGDLLTESVDGEGRKTVYGRRPDGKVVSITRPKGTASDAVGDHQVTLDYFPTGEIKARTLPYAERQFGSHDLKVSYGLNDVGHPTTVTDPRGKSITNTFLDSGELKSTTRPSWWTVKGGRPTERPAGQSGGGETQKPQTEGEGDFGGVVRAPSPGLLPKAGRTDFAYDNELRLTGVTDVAGKAVSIGRDPVGRVIETRRPLDASRTIVDKTAHDFNGNPSRLTDPVGEVTTRTFDQFDRAVSDARPGSNEGVETTKTSYNPNDTVSRVETARGPGFASTTGYDALDRPIRSEDANGNVTTREYDAVGNVTMERSPRGNRATMPAGETRGMYESTRTYNAADELKLMRNGFGHEWLFEYDKHGNQTKVDAPGASRGPGDAEQRQITDRSYDGLDRLWTEQTGSGANGGDRKRTKVYEYDPNGLLRRMVNPAGVNDATGLPNFTYSADSHVSDSEAAKHATVHEYNDPEDPTLMSAKRLPWGDRDADDSKRYRQTFAYDGRGRMARIDPPHEASPTDAAKTTYTHLETGWVKTATDSYKKLDYDYDVRGDQTSWKSTKLGQSNAGREMSRTYWPSGKLRTRSGVKPSVGPDELYRYSYEYNRNRSLKKMTDGRRNRTTTYEYDPAERQTEVNESSFQIEEEIRRGKDTHLRYDENGNVLERRTDGRFTDPSGYTGGKRAVFDYDRLDREISMTVTAASEPDRTTSTSWWDSGQRRERTTRRTGAGADTVERRFAFSDGRLSRMDRRRIGAPAGSFAKNRSYDYDANGNRTADERGTHAYNSRDQLVAFDKTNGPRTTYSLNGSGSITSQSKSGQTTTFKYAADGERLLSASGGGATTTYNYDDGGLGEIVGYSVTGGTSETTFRYDEFGRQTFSDDGKGKAATYSFDGLDRRDTKRESTKMMDLSYVGSSESLSQEQQFDGGDETRSYDYDAGMERLGMARRNAGQTSSRYRNYSKDANGSVEGLENDQGEVADGDKYAYDPYGQSAHTDPAAGEDQEVQEPTGADAQANPFRFEGHYYDSNVKTYDMQARPYLPQAGRFLTEDRFESAAGDLSLESDTLTQDRYAFAGGNPVNNIEFDGHEPIGSYQNGCDNHYGSDERCAQESAPRRQASARNQRDYSYAYSNNWAKGRSTSPSEDSSNAYAHAERNTPQPQAKPAPAPEQPGVVEKGLGVVNEYTINAQAEDLSCLDPRKGCQAVSVFGNDPIEALTSTAGGGVAGKVTKEAAELCAKNCPRIASDLFSRVGGFADETGSIGGGGGAKGASQSIQFSDKQFGSKLGQHARDFGLDPSDAADRSRFREIVQDIATRPDRVAEGAFRGQGPGGAAGPVSFRVKGPNVVVTKPDDEFVTVLKDGINNPSVRRALGQ